MNREEPLSDLGLWLASTLPGYCVLTRAEATPSGDAAALATSDSLAYVTSRPARRRPKSFVELVVNGHGPDAGHLIDRLVDQIRSWDAQHRYGPGPEFQAHLVGEEVPAGFQIARRHSCFTVSWPGDPAAAGS
jgi:protein-L-isoaspartate(D-aspartate) O-methyltransferase